MFESRRVKVIRGRIGMVHRKYHRGKFVVVLCFFVCNLTETENIGIPKFSIHDFIVI